MTINEWLKQNLKKFYSVLKTKFVTLGDDGLIIPTQMPSVQSDYNETNEENNSYINNKPFQLGQITKVTDIFPEQQVENFYIDRIPIIKDENGDYYAMIYITMLYEGDMETLVTDSGDSYLDINKQELIDSFTNKKYIECTVNGVNYGKEIPKDVELTTNIDGTQQTIRYSYIGDNNLILLLFNQDTITAEEGRNMVDNLEKNYALLYFNGMLALILLGIPPYNESEGR